MKTSADQPETIEAYLAQCEPQAAASLQQTRQQILALVPGPTELISYQIPTIKYRDAPLVAYAAYPKHCSLYTMSKAVVARYREELAGYKTTDTAIHFKAGTTLPAGLLQRVTADRMEETDLMLAQRAARREASRKAKKTGR